MAVEASRRLRGLAAAYARLDEQQQEAVDARDDTVVLAGPGSGKTDTLAVKGAVLLREIQPPRGVAAITYTRAAARELSERITALGERPGRRLFAGTVHSFCLRAVIKPFAPLSDKPLLAQREVIGSRAAEQLLRRASDAEGLPNPPGPPRLQWMRRTAASREDLTQHFDHFEVAVMHRYEALLVDGDLIDFDGMIHEALRIVQSNPVVPDLLSAQYPWLLVDEYQDLGSPLHHLVQQLRRAAEVNVMAVGDPDQTIMQFTGADPRYLDDLEASACRRIALPFNYRSGRRLIDAAAGVRDIERHYEPHPENEDEGEVLSIEVAGGIVPQVSKVVDELIPRLTENDERPLHEIAILYPQRSRLLDVLCQRLDEGGIAYSLERDARFGQLGEVVGWLQRSSQWALDLPTERAIRFRELADDLRAYLLDAKHPAGITSLAAAEFLYPVLEAGVDPDSLLLDWLNQMLEKLDLRVLLADGGIHAQDVEALDGLLSELRGGLAGTTVGAFAGPVRRPGRVVVTTYHSAKGRQFDAVILPGMQDGMMPRARKRSGEWRIGNVDDDRKLFYVGITRARYTAALLWSKSSEDAYGDPASWPRSRFIEEVERRLS